MFNLNKDEVEQKTEQLSKRAKNNVDVASKEIKATADDAADLVKAKTEATKDQATHLIDSLKSLLREYSDTEKINRVKDQISVKASELKEVVAEEVSHAYEKTKQKTADTVVEHPVGTLALAAGAGLLLGYILASKQSSK